MTDFADSNPALTRSNIHSFAQDGYKVVVYYGNNEYFASPGFTITVNGVTEAVQTGQSYGTTGYVQDTPGTNPPHTDESNYAVFDGIIGDTLNVSFSSPQNDGISAIQIIQVVPEPCTAAVGLALVGLSLVRRHRRA